MTLGFVGKSFISKHPILILAIGLITALLTFNGFVELLGYPEYKIILSSKKKQPKSVSKPDFSENKPSQIIIKQTAPTYQQNLNNNKIEKELWENSLRLNSLNSYNTYLDKFPKGKWSQRAQKKIELFKNKESTLKHIKTLQLLLQELRCYNGAVDGKWGKKSQKAFDEYKPLLKSRQNIEILFSNDPATLLQIISTIKKYFHTCARVENIGHMKLAFACVDKSKNKKFLLWVHDGKISFGTSDSKFSATNNGFKGKTRLNKISHKYEGKYITGLQYNEDWISISYKILSKNNFAGGLVDLYIENFSSNFSLKKTVIEEGQQTPITITNYFCG